MVSFRVVSLSLEFILVIVVVVFVTVFWLGDGTAPYIDVVLRLLRLPATLGTGFGTVLSLVARGEGPGPEVERSGSNMARGKLCGGADTRLDAERDGMEVDIRFAACEGRGIGVAFGERSGGGECLPLTEFE